MQRRLSKGWAISLAVVAVLVLIRLFAWENEWLRFAGLLLVIANGIWILRSSRADRGEPE